MFLSNLGKIGDNKRQNTNIFLKVGAGVVCLVSLSWWCFIVSTGAGGQALWVVVLPFVVCSLLLSSFSLCLWCIVLEYALISRFKGVFSEVWGCCVGLCCSCALRGLWGFCTRVELGGLKALGVFPLIYPSIYPFICLSFYLFTCFLSCLSSLCPALLWLFFVVIFLDLCLCFLFPLRYIRKKGRNFLRPLLSCCGLVMQNRVLRSRKIRNR